MNLVVLSPAQESSTDLLQRYPQGRANGRIHNMKSAGKIRLVVLAIVVVLIFFDVSFPLELAPSYEARVPDPAVEAEYERCYRERDQAMHEVAFGTIDNPDVQKEFISTNRERIARECRELVPERFITVQEPARINLVDMKPRFW